PVEGEAPAEGAEVHAEAQESVAEGEAQPQPEAVEAEAGTTEEVPETESEPGAPPPHHAEEHRVSGTPATELQAEHEMTEPDAPSQQEGVETGQGFEGEAAAGVENAPEPDVAEVHTHGEESQPGAPPPHHAEEHRVSGTPVAVPHKHGVA